MATTKGGSEVAVGYMRIYARMDSNFKKQIVDGANGAGAGREVGQAFERGLKEGIGKGSSSPAAGTFKGAAAEAGGEGKGAARAFLGGLKDGMRQGWDERALFRSAKDKADGEGESTGRSFLGGLKTGVKSGWDSRGLFKGTKEEGTKAGKDAGAGIETGLGASLGRVKGLIGAAMGAAAVGQLVGGLNDATSAAANLEQSVGAIDTVFKGSAGQMHTWANGAAESVGLAANEYNELGTLIGSQLKNGGTAMDELAPKTNNMIKLGADLSSMYGGTTREAVEALSSALKGEMDPIEKYGISLNDAALKAEAASLGIKTVGGNLSTSGKQAAVMSLLMKQSADAQGNFGREADTAAHKQEVLNAKLENAKTAFGTALLPVRTFLLEGATKLLEWAQKQGPALDKVKAALAPVGAAFGTAKNAVAQFVAAFRDDKGGASSGVAQNAKTAADSIRNAWAGLVAWFGPVWAQIKSIAATGAEALRLAVVRAVQLLTAAWHLWGDDILAFLRTTWSNVQTVFKAGLGVLQGIVRTVLAVLRGDWSGAWNGLVQIVSNVWTILKTVVSQGLNILKLVLSMAWTGIKAAASAAWGAIKNAIVGVVSSLKTTLSKEAQNWKNVLGAAWGAIKNAAGVAWRGILTVISAVWGAIRTGLTTYVNGWKTILSACWTAIRTTAVAAWNLIKGALSVAWSAIRTALSLVISGWKTLLSNAWSAIYTTATRAWSVIKTGLSTAWTAIRTLLSNALTGWKTLLSNAWSAINTTAVRAWGVIKGSLGTAFTNVKTSITTAVTNWKKILSDCWASVKSTAETTWGKIVGFFGGLKQTMSDKISGIVSGVSGAWEKVQEAFRKPVSWVVEHALNPLIRGWNAVMDKVDKGKHIDTIKYADGGPVAPPRVASAARATFSRFTRGFGFAGGGLIPGTPAIGYDDRMGIVDGRELVGIGSGEYIVNAANTRIAEPLLNVLNYGSDQTVRRLMGMFTGFASGGIPGYADGGVARAIGFARAQMAHATRNWYHRCLEFVNDTWADSVGWTHQPTARIAGNLARSTGRLHGGNPPAGSFVWFDTGKSGHVALGDGGGNVYSTDWGRKGGVGLAPIAQMSQQWGKFLGWWSPTGATGGGPLPEGSFIGSLLGMFGPAFDWVLDKAEGVINSINGRFGGTGIAGMLSGIGKGMLESVRSYIEGTVGFGGDAPGEQTFNVADGSARSIVQQMAASRGWTGAQWSALDWIVSKESGWNPHAANPTSSARGLFQKMTSVNGPLEPTVQGQANWGLNYIASRYGDPIRAQRFWRAHNWYADGGLVKPTLYDAGGVLRPGVHLVENRTGRPEYILPSEVTDRLMSGGASSPQSVRHYTINTHDDAPSIVRAIRRLDYEDAVATNLRGEL